LPCLVSTRSASNGATTGCVVAAKRIGRALFVVLPVVLDVRHATT
jgi:hypothetical protein